ncbi:hypothetical protein PABG_05621 [Paracoccidioides brasiliensis Pb03]|nr:hypothetical protein PABG_05621 [Paracoccidioides brasiliensis Pb03]
MGLLGRILTFLAIIAATSAGLAQSSPDAKSLGKRESEPCKLVADAYKEQSSEDPDGPFLISAQLAHACLTSVPINRGDALRLVDGLISFWKWQSTIDYLKDPPSGYLLPKTDLVAGLEIIRKKVSREEYTNEYDFQRDLSALAKTTHDSHFSLKLDAASVFHFRRSKAGPLVSFSEKGNEPLKVYSYFDLQAKNPDFAPSPIQEIDGKNVVEWLTGLSYGGTTQDPDALYNELFWSIPAETNGVLGGFYAQSGVYTGASVALKFENGTVKEYENMASFTTPFTDVVDGKSFYAKFCSSELGKGFKKMKRDYILKAAPIVAPRAEKNKRPLYPKPVVEMQGGDVAGYFLQDDYSDTAVLSATSFMGTGSQGSVKFQDAVTTFLSECKKAGKKKLIVDVTRNGGGTILLGYDLFKQLLPKVEPADAFNIRAHEQLDIIGTKVHDMLNDGKETPQDRDERDGIYDTGSYLNMDNKKFSSWDDYYGPDTVGKDYKFSNLGRWDFNNRVLSIRSSGGIVVSGYLDRKNMREEYFKAEDIVLLTDGTCGSTCAIFANLMQKAGVKTIVVGGRPQTGPMQAIGGVKGTQVLTYQRIYYTAARVFDSYSTPQEKRQWAGTDLGEIYRVGKYILARTVDDGEGARVNFRNGIDPKDKDRIPLQFVYEAAGCRIWTTRPMLNDITKLWEAVSDTTFRGKSNCLPESVGKSPENKNDGGAFHAFSAEPPKMTLYAKIDR